MNMKKILITLTLLFSFLLTFSQDFSIAKSSRMSFGEKNDYTGEFKFNPFTVKEIGKSAFAVPGKPPLPEVNFASKVVESIR